MRKRPLSRAEQAAEQLKQLVSDGSLGPELPGVETLAVECGVSPVTMRQGLRILERDGCISNLGPGRRRTVHMSSQQPAKGRSLQVAMLSSSGRESIDLGYRKVLDVFESELFSQGHRFFILPVTQRDLGYDTGRIIKRVEKEKVDLWLVESAQAELLRWFANRPQPVFACGGQFLDVPGLPATGSATVPVTMDTVRRLCQLGHRRIVCLKAGPLRKNLRFRQILFTTLEESGIKPSNYNLPDWEETPEGLHQLLDSLFRVSPPTALIVASPVWMQGVLSFLALRGHKTPDHVSLVCERYDPGLEWCRPQITHFQHDDDGALRILRRWMKGMMDGKPYTKQTLLSVEVVPGGTVGPAPRRK